MHCDQIARHILVDSKNACRVAKYMLDASVLYGLDLFTGYALGAAVLCSECDAVYIKALRFPELHFSLMLF